MYFILIIILKKYGDIGSPDRSNGVFFILYNGVMYDDFRFNPSYVSNQSDIINDGVWIQHYIVFYITSLRFNPRPKSKVFNSNSHARHPEIWNEVRYENLFNIDNIGHWSCLSTMLACTSYVLEGEFAF